MSKIYILLMALFWTAAANAQAPTDKDREKIVQQCIDLKELTPVYAHESQLYIMDSHGSFGDIHPSYKGKDVLFLNKEQVKYRNLNAYFLFWIFEVNEKDARVLFVYKYNQNSTEPKDSKATVLLEKQGDNWIIKNTKSSW